MAATSLCRAVKSRNVSESRGGGIDEEGTGLRMDHRSTNMELEKDVRNRRTSPHENQGSKGEI